MPGGFSAGSAGNAAQSRADSGEGDLNEIVLNPDTDYLVRITNLGTSASTSGSNLFTYGMGLRTTF